MGYNPFEPTAGARVNVLCVPASHVTPERFQGFIKLLQHAAIARLRTSESAQAVEGSHIPNQCHVPGLTSLDGARVRPQDSCIFYDISASQDNGRPHLFPFETNSRCQILLCLIDGESIERDRQADADGTSDVLQSIRTSFSQQFSSLPGLLVRQLIWCGKTLPSSLDPDVLFLSDSGGGNAAENVMATLSTKFTDGAVFAIQDFKDKPVSMVPGGGSPVNHRSGNTPNPANGTLPQSPEQSPSPIPGLRETETQVRSPRLHGLASLL